MPRAIGPYVPQRLLGYGSTAEVWAARDGEREVAIKWWRGDADSPERELRALSLLDVPGVVRLIDHGEHQGRPFAVTECIDGLPFPGPDIDMLVSVTRRLLVILEGVHSLGVVHRDLKPRNVLVTPRGDVHLLDFGLAGGSLLGATLSGDGHVAGTLRYMAPEQLLGQHADPRSDLYAVGVMVWEAFAGEALHGEDVASLVHRRLSEPARTLGEIAPAVPAAVCRCVDALLQRDPEGRPGRAAEALAQLSARPLEGLPWLGPRTPIEQALGLLRSGRSCRVGGGVGEGVGRLLREVIRELGRDREFRQLRPDDRPFGSIPLDGADTCSVDEAMELAREVLTEQGQRPVIWLADRMDRVDPWTRDLLLDVDVPTLARAEPADVYPERLTVEDVLPLFGGCERIHRLRSDPARLLIARTHGRAGRVADELSSWVARGLAQTEPHRPHLFVPPPETARVWVNRESLDRLREEPAPTAVAPMGLSGSMAEHLDWVAFVGPAATSEVVARLRGVPSWEAALERELLQELQCVVMHDGAVQLMRGGQGVWAWSVERRRAAHRQVVEVLEPGAAGRLRHLTTLGEFGDAVVEAAVVVREEHEAGRTARAYARAVSLLEVAGAEPAAVDLWLQGLKTALSLRTKETVGRLRRAAVRHPPADSTLVQMVRAGDEILGGRPASGLARLEGLDGHPREEVEVERFGLMVMAGQRMGVAVQRRLVASAGRTLGGLGDAVCARVLTWRGLTAYRCGDYRRAAQEHLDALARRTTLAGQLSSMLNAAACLQLDDSADAWTRSYELTVQAEERALAVGHLSYVARAQCIRRTLLHRRGTTVPDLELAEAMRHQPEAIHVEAMIAARGHHPSAKDLTRAALDAQPRADLANHCHAILHYLSAAGTQLVGPTGVWEEDILCLMRGGRIGPRPTLFTGVLV